MFYLYFYGQVEFFMSFSNIFYASIIFILSQILIFYFRLMLNAFGFFIENSESIYNLVIRTTQNLSRFPLDAFPKSIGFILTYIIPVAFTTYYPILILKNRGNVFSIILIESSVFFVVFFLSKLFWKRGLRRYSGVSV